MGGRDVTQPQGQDHNDQSALKRLYHFGRGLFAVIGVLFTFATTYTGVKGASDMEATYDRGAVQGFALMYTQSAHQDPAGTLQRMTTKDFRGVQDLPGAGTTYESYWQSVATVKEVHVHDTKEKNI